MTDPDAAVARDLVQQVFIRVCRDSGFTLATQEAAALAAGALGLSPLQIWMAMPSLDVMDKIAAGTHPITGRGHTGAKLPKGTGHD